MKSQEKNVLLGIPIGQQSVEVATERALAAINRKSNPVVFACAMSHSLNVAHSDLEFANALREADIVVADGVGVTLMGRLAGVDVGTRIAGEEFFFSLMNALEKSGKGRVFFFGATNKALDLISERFQREFPSLELCGVLSPPFRPWSVEENREMVENINSTSPDVLWVGMGAPKQEKWVYQNYNSLNAPLIGSIGAVFDYFAGTNPPPPRWVRRYGLETPYRLMREPRRLWRRAIISNMMFVLRVLQEHILGFGRKRPSR